MERVCFTLQVKRGRLDEYVARHRTVWPEMLEALRECGWNNYSLFLRSDGLLIGYLETDDFGAARMQMQEREVNARWQREMGEFFEHSPDVTPDRAMKPIDEVFHLD